MLTPSPIEPARLDAPSAVILDLVTELAGAAGRLGGIAPPRTARALGDLVRVLDTHYSHRLAGQDADPRDIARALAYDFSPDPGRRHVQEQAASHVRLRATLDGFPSPDRVPEPASRAFVAWLHHDYYLHGPEEMLRVTGPSGREFVMSPGQWRHLPDHDARFEGPRRPPAYADLPQLMLSFEARYRFEELGTSARILAIPAAHRRFDAIHPFPEGNGRVARLMSHAMLVKAGVGARGLWSLSRGLALGLRDRGEYARLLHAGDGDPSRPMETFAYWFLRVCIEQVTFMTQLFAPAELGARLRRFVQQSGTMRVEAAPLLEDALVRGEFQRAEASRITGLADRHAQRAVDDLQRAGLLGADRADGPLALRFPMSAVDSLFPRLHSL